MSNFYTYNVQHDAHYDHLQYVHTQHACTVCAIMYSWAIDIMD